MNEHKQRMLNLLRDAGEKLRAFQLYEIGLGHGHVDNATNNHVITALTNTFEAQRRIEKSET